MVALKSLDFGPIAQFAPYALYLAQGSTFAAVERIKGFTMLRCRVLTGVVSNVILAASIIPAPAQAVGELYRYFDGGDVKTEAGHVTVNGIGGSIARTYSGAEGALHTHEVGVSLRFPIGC